MPYRSPARGNTKRLLFGIWDLLVIVLLTLFFVTWAALTVLMGYGDAFMRSAFAVAAVVVSLEAFDELTMILTRQSVGLGVLGALPGSEWPAPKVILALCVAGYFVIRPDVSWRLLVLVPCGVVLLSNITPLLL